MLDLLETLVKTVAPCATGEIDLRDIHAADRDWALARIGTIMDGTHRARHRAPREAGL
jgi:hypothetical protein